MASIDARKMSTGPCCSNKKLEDKSIWNQRREAIYHLYIIEDLTLKGVKRVLENEYGFPNFRLRDYEVVLRDYFGFRKNLSTKDWQAISIHLENRLQLGEQSDVYLNGYLMEKTRVERAVRRSRKKLKFPYRAHPVPALPNGIMILTPSPLMTCEVAAHRIADSFASQNLSHRPAGQLKLTKPMGSDEMPTTTKNGWQTPENLTFQDMRLHVAFSQFIETTVMAICRLVYPPANSLPSPSVAQWSIRPNLPPIIMKLGYSPHIQMSEQTSTLTGPLRETIERQLRSRATLRSIKSLSGRFSFERLMYIFSMMSNKRCFYEDDGIDLLEWVDSNELDILRPFFTLPLPTMAATWEALMDLPAITTRPVAFTKLIEVSMSIHDGRWLKARAGDVLCLAIWLRLGPLTQRLLSRGLSSNTKAFRQYLHSYKDENGHSRALSIPAWPLQVALICADPQAVRLLLAHGAMVKEDTAWFVLHSYIEVGPESLEDMYQCFRLALEAGAPVDLMVGHWREDMSPLAKLGWSGKYPAHLLDRIWRKVDKHEAWRQVYHLAAECSEMMKSSLTVAGLCNAASFGHHELQDYMSHRAYPSGVDRTLILEVALSEAASKGDLIACKGFLQNGVDPNVENYSTALHDFYDSPDHKKNYEHFTQNPEMWRPGELVPVFGALKENNALLLDLFLTVGADLNRCNLLDAMLFGDVYKEDWINSALSASSRRLWVADETPVVHLPAPEKVEALFRVLTTAGLNIHAYGGEAMAKAVLRQKDDETMFLQCDWLHSKGINWDFEWEGCNLIHLVIRYGRQVDMLDKVKFLVARGVKVDSSPCHIGNTILHDAILRPCHEDVVDLLLSHGADVHRCSQRGFTVLQELFEARTTCEVDGLNCKKLLQAGAPLVSPENPFQDVARTAVLGGLLALPEVDDEMIIPFLETTASTKLCYDAEIPANLQRGYQRVNEWRDTEKQSPLQAAVAARRFTIATELLRRGSDAQHTTSPFVIALQPSILVCAEFPEDQCAADFLRCLVRDGSDINSHAGNGLTALQRASAEGSLNIASLLLENGANPNVLSKRVFFKLLERATEGKRQSYRHQSYYGLFYRHQTQEDFDPDKIYEHDEEGKILMMQPCIPCIDVFGPVWAPRALDLAAITGRLDMVQMLLNAGGISGYSRTGPYDGSIDCAKENQHHAIACLLQEANVEFTKYGASFEMNSAFQGGCGLAWRQ